LSEVGFDEINDLDSGHLKDFVLELVYVAELK